MGEWGQINRGQTYGILCRDIDRALAHVGLSPLEAMLMQRVREESWGITRWKQRNRPWPEPQLVELNVSELAREWGVNRPRLQDAKLDLVNRHILIEHRATGRVEINKEVHQWTGLSAAGLAYARRAIDVYPDSETTSDDDENTASCSQTGTPPVPDQEHPCSQTGTPPVPDQEQAQASPQTPIEDRARQKSSEDIKKTPEGAHAASVVEQVVRDIFRLTDDHGDPDPNVCGQLRAWTAKQSEAAVIAAAHQAMRAAAGDPVRYFIGMCRKGLDDPEKAPPPRASPNGKPDPPIEYHVAPPEAKNRKWTMGTKR